ncbi:MAG: hypothetical protein AB7X49_07360, partial [Geminicoccaceae bacterium]
MTMSLERRLGAVERRMGVGTGPLTDFSDADLLAAIEWVCTALGDAGSETLAREDEEEAKLKAHYERPDIARRPDIEEGWRWPYQRARALSWERRTSYAGPDSAATPEELQTKISAALATMR